jgi:inositol polyphosphate 5-phosphatase INPP5A
MGPLKELLFEYDINFPPSYPYEEDPKQPGSYMFTRCPAWCDRILLSPAAKALLDESEEEVSKIYGIIGENVCMGDHKVSTDLGLMRS